ncbi:MAG: dienelactone hydrolase [Anaerolineae bacterium]|nr:dienelactone hydrolase [Anaerolineae bacterium]
MKRVMLLAVVLVLLVSTALVTAQGPGSEDFVFGDLLPDAPELAPRGDYGVGVQTLTLTNPDQIDIVNYTAGEDEPRYDRPLTVEVWYPAVIPEGVEMLVEYEETLGYNGRRDLIPFTFAGRALRDAEPDTTGAAYPLLIVSHGFPGSRYMLTYLTENLASKGYVVVAIDHTDSTFSDAGAFTSTLLNRSLDILFVLDEMERLGAADGEGFLAGLLDASRTGLIGYSMGGYGAINAAGAGYSAQAVGLFERFSGGSQALQIRAAGNAEFEASRDERIQAVIAFAPWGMALGLWDADGLAGLDVPTLFVDGSQDDVAGYENGVRAIYEGAVNADRYLLTYVNARHNVAPNPPPAEAFGPGIPFDDYMRYAEPAWSEYRINNINQHFVTAFFGIYLQGQDYAAYLDLIPDANAGVFDVDEEGNPTEEHTHWAGFLPRTAVGMTFEHATP